MAQTGASDQPVSVLDDPAWFGAVMGSGGTAIVASMLPGRIEFLTAVGDVTAVLLLVASGAAFVGLCIRDFLVKRLGRGLVNRLRSPRTGPAYATIPGAVNVLAVGLITVWPATMSTAVGWGVLAALAAVGTVLGLWLTVTFFVAAFEHEQFRPRTSPGSG